MVFVLQQDPQGSLILQLIGEHQAERSGVGIHTGTEQPGFLAHCLRTGLNVQVVSQTCERTDTAKLISQSAQFN